MKNVLLKKGGCFAVILILTTISTIPITAIMSEKGISPNPTQMDEEFCNLGTVEVIYYQPWPYIPPRWKPEVNFSLCEECECEFPETNGTVKLKFFLECKHKRNTWLWPFPLRWTQFSLTIWSGGNYIYIKDFYQWRWYGCNGIKSYDWLYANISIDQNDHSTDKGWLKSTFETNGENQTIGFYVSVRSFPHMLLGQAQASSCIIVPIT